MKKTKKKIILVCSVCLSRNYSLFKSQSMGGSRLELQKYCSKCGKHQIHKETR